MSQETRIYAFVSRIPKHCTHGRDVQTVYLTNNPNQTSVNDYVEPGSRDWRNMMLRKIRQNEQPPNPDDWPDWYYVTSCDACENERRSAWEDLHWDRNPWRRQNKAVYALAYLEVQTMPSERFGWVSKLTEQSAEELLAIIKNSRLTRYDFKIIDERPGQWGYEIDGREWHWKLRQVRNSNNRLFEILAENEAAGIPDNNAVPPIPPGWQPDWWPL